MTELRIEGKTYKLEYTFEASLYKDCVDKVFEIVSASADASLQQDATKVLATLAGNPGTVITLFYAGCIENNKLESEEEAKELLKKYFKEHKGEKTANFHSLFNKIQEQMTEDGFFDLIGLTQLTQEMTEAAKQMPKQPQDHKRKLSSVK